jgi:hypothetical protein
VSAPRQLQACLEALASQAVQTFCEFVVVDDFSPEPPHLSGGKAGDFLRLSARPAG